MFIQQPLDEFLGFQYEKMSETSVRITLPIKPLFLNSVGVVHGGVISSLADVALCNAIGVDENNKQKAVTLDLNITFLKGAKGEYLVAHAEAFKKGRTLAHSECSIYDDKENLVAKAKAILFNLEDR